MDPLVIACLNDKANAPGDLQPKIFSSILELYHNGQSIMTARDVRENCINIFPNNPWKERFPAICNAMRNACDCGATIISEDRDHFNFTISFDKRKELEKSKIGTNKKSIQIKENHKIGQANSITDREKKLEILRNPDMPKLLIIGCSDAKVNGGNVVVNPQDLFHDELLDLRASRRNYYNDLFAANPNHFIRNGKNEFQRFNHANNNNLFLPAYKRYDGKFFSEEHRSQYECVNQNHGWHILIISGLYGVLDYRDEIIDYHLTISKGGNWHGNVIHKCIQNYQQNNGINDDNVFYNVSNSYSNAINALPRWDNLWQGGDWGQRSANKLLEFFNLFSVCE